MKFTKSAALLALALLLAGCDPLKSNLVVVLPEDNGHVGAVVIKPDAGGESTVLNQAFSAIHAEPGDKVEAVAMDRDKVNRLFGPALAARPQPPRSFLLYFQEGKDELTAESKPEFEAMFAEISRRPVADVVVIGHTDRVGSLTDNDKLALKRAEAMRGILIKRGIPADAVAVAGRGEREPLVATADETPEPRNRRVEISVR